MLKIDKIPTRRVNYGSQGWGSVILYGGKHYVFERTPKGARSIYVRDIKTEKHFRIPLDSDPHSMYFDMVGFCNIPEANNDFLDLRKGDLFVINHERKGCVIFRFERTTDINMVAINPLNNKTVLIPLNKFYSYTKIEHLPY